MQNITDYICISRPQLDYGLMDLATVKQLKTCIEVKEIVVLLPANREEINWSPYHTVGTVRSLHHYFYHRSEKQTEMITLITQIITHYNSQVSNGD